MTTVTPAVQAYERRKLGKQGKVERASKTARLVVDPSRAAGQKYMEPPAAAPELYALRQQFAKGQSRSAAYGRSISFGGEGVSLNSLASKWSGNTKGEPHSHGSSACPWTPTKSNFDMSAVS